MAIKPCKECGAPVSDKAESCPRCGAKQPKKTSTLTWIVLFLILSPVAIVMFGSGGGDNTQPEAATTKKEENKAGVLLFMAEQQIRSGAKDPSSIEFRNQQLHQKTEYGAAACGEVNGKNSFGGYTGYKGFVVTEKDSKIYMEDSENHNEFVKKWNKICVK